MTTKFDHIKLGRAFRPHVLAALKNLSGWPSYMSAKGWGGRSSLISTPDIREACEALGFDLTACYEEFFSKPHEFLKDKMTTERDNEVESDTMDSEGEGYEGKDIDAVIAEALAPASVHMTPYLAEMLPGVLRPIVEAATKGPRVVVKTETVVKTIVKDGDGETVSENAPSVNVLKRSALAHAFGLRKSDAPVAFRHAMESVFVNVCDYANAPKVDPDYIWSVEALAQLGAADACGMNVWTFGPAGIGKTDGARQYAARLGRPFVRIAIDRTTEPQEIIGQMMPRKGGGMEWRDGKLTRAFRIPHCVILIDEPTLLRSGTLAVFQTALDTREIQTVTGETIRAADGVFIVAADNTAGMGDDSGRFVDTAPVNAAFLDRFALRVEFSYLSEGQETTMLAARTGVPSEAARIMVEYANLTRQNSDAGKLTMGVTPRRLLAWARAAKAGIASAKAFSASVITGSAPEDKEVLIMLEGQTLRSQHAQIDNIVRGIVSEPSMAPSAAGLAFPEENDTL